MTVVLLCWMLAAPTPHADAATCPCGPGGFTDATIGGLNAPTAMAMLPDGRVLVAEQTGSLRVVKGGALLPQPFVTLNVDSSGERGLLGVAVDLGFPQCSPAFRCWREFTGFAVMPVWLFTAGYVVAFAYPAGRIYPALPAHQSAHGVRRGRLVETMRGRLTQLTFSWGALEVTSRTKQAM